MVRNRVALVSLAIALISSSAHPQKPPIASIELEKTACFGTCPIYTVKIFGDGRVRYDGKDFVKERGPRTASISPSRFRELAAKVEEIGFFNLAPKYRANVTDLPTTIITVTRGNEIKRVEDYFGAPKELHDLEGLIEQVAAGWVTLNQKAAAPEYEHKMRR